MPDYMSLKMRRWVSVFIVQQLFLVWFDALDVFFTASCLTAKQPHGHKLIWFSYSKPKSVFASAREQGCQSAARVSRHRNSKRQTCKKASTQKRVTLPSPRSRHRRDESQRCPRHSGWLAGVHPPERWARRHVSARREELSHGL